LAATALPHEYFPACSISLKKSLARVVKISCWLQFFFIPVADVVTCKSIFTLSQACHGNELKKFFFDVRSTKAKEVFFLILHATTA